MIPTEIKSTLWSGLVREIDRTLQDKGDNPTELLHFITKFGCYTFPREASDPLTEKIVADYLAWLEENGTPLSAFPSEIAESAFVHPSTVFLNAGRVITTMFLFHLCIAMRVKPFLPHRPKILEIGGGYGGLARIAKLIWPKCSYTIVDIPESLKFSRLFLEQNFPNACFFSADAETNRRSFTKRPKFDFETVSTDQIAKLHGRSFDIVINTCSFGEMTQSTVNSYHDFIESKINTRFLYSINRFGRRPFGDVNYQAPREAGGDTAHICLFPSADWDVRVWDCWNESGFAEIEVAAAPYLEILLERPRRTFGIGNQYIKKSYRLLDAAKNLNPDMVEWHYCLFNAIRYYPTQSAIQRYLTYLDDRNWPEAHFFKNLVRSAPPDLGQVNMARAHRYHREPLFNELKFTRLSRVYNRRMRERLGETDQLIAQMQAHIRNLEAALRKPKP